MLSIKELELVKRTSVAVSMVQSNVSDMIFSTLKVALDIDENEVIIPGYLFEPPVTKEPSLGKALDIVGDSITDISGIIVGYTKNGEFYDVRVCPQEDARPNVKFVII